MGEKPSEPAVCHYCESEGADLYDCPRCDQPTCEDCFDTNWRPGEPPDCLECCGNAEAFDWQERVREAEIREAAEKKRAARNAATRARYWKPENIAKRTADRAERKRVAAEAARKRLAEAFRIVGDMMR